MNKKILAIIALVFVLMGVLVIPLAAYPASSFVGSEPNRVYLLSTSGTGVGSRAFDVVTREEVITKGYVDVFFGDIQFTPDPAAASDVWKQVAFTVEPVETSGGFYNVNFGGTAGNNFYARLGTHFYGVDNYPVLRRDDTADYFSGRRLMVGFHFFSAPSGDDVQVFLTMQLYFCNVSGSGEASVYTPVYDYSYTYLIPDSYNTFQFRVFCISSSANFTYVGKETTMPHMPSDLLDYQTIAGQGDYVQGYEEGLTEGKQQGYDLGFKDGTADATKGGLVVSKTFWQIISMPFDLLFGLLNFELFGVNVWPIVTAVLSIGLVLFLLRKVGVL